MVQNPKAHGGPPNDSLVSEPVQEYSQPVRGEDTVTSPTEGIDEPITGSPYATQTYGSFTYGEG